MQSLLITVLLLINFLEILSKCFKNCLECTKEPKNLQILCNQCITGYILNENNKCIKAHSINSHYIEKIFFRNLGKIMT